MKNLLSIVLALIMLLSLAACGESAEPAPADPAPETQQELSPLDAARVTDVIIHQSITDAELCMNLMYEKIMALDSDGTPEEVIAHCEEAIQICSDARKLIQSVPEKEISAEYLEQAEGYITNVEVAHISARDVLSKGDKDAYDQMNDCVELHETYGLLTAAARVAYLYDVGLPEDEIDEILAVDEASAQSQNEPLVPEQNAAPAQEQNKTPSPEQDEASGWTTEQKNAMNQALKYLDYSGFSREDLIEQLEYEQYSHEAAVWAADNCGADWNAEALESAQRYIDYSGFSYEGLIEQLKYEGYTAEQAAYGVDNCGADWYAEAAEKAESYLSHSSFSRAELIEQLEYEGFTHEQAVYGAEQNGY